MKIAKIMAVFASVILSTTIIGAQGETQQLCVDESASRFTIQVGSAGFLKMFGHDHQIEARQIRGCALIDWSRLEQSSVDLAFASSGLQVADKEHKEDIPEVQKEMETNVLRVGQFPEIRFKSERVQVRKASDLIIEGALTIRGRTEKAAVPVNLRRLADGRVNVSGSYNLRQSDFGIEPVRVGGGLVRVKDEVRCDFNLVLR